MSGGRGHSSAADNDEPRTEKIFISVSATAAIVCGVILLVLLIQVTQSRARLQLQQDGVGEFNFVQQLDHNFDSFANALLALRLERADTGAVPTPLAGNSEVVQRFDVLYSSMRGIGDRRAGSLAEFSSGARALAQMNRFIDDHEQSLLPGNTLTDTELDLLAVESQRLSKVVYQLGLELFQFKSRLYDEVNSRADYLSRVSWFFGASFVLAGLTLYILLARASRRASRLFHQARSSQRQLETALEELTSGDIQRKAQNRFLATATHDLRQPLQALQYYITALDSHVSSAAGRDILTNTARTTDSAQSMLNALLDISKLDAGVLEPEMGNVSLHAMFMELQSTHAADAADRGLALSFDATDAWVRTDPQFLNRILANLIGNALNYTSAGSVRVGVVSDESAGTHKVFVEDTGIGIPERELEAIFNEYYQLEKSDDGVPVTRQHQGMGLGLSIVRRLVRLLGTSLDVTSEPGRGSRFTLALPTGERTMPASVDPFSDRQRSADDLTGLAIMIIDDDARVRDGVTTLLSQHGCELMTSEDASGAIELLIAQDRTPDLILADYQLKDGLTGVEAIETVRQEVNEDVPAIVITGDTRPEPLQAARERGYGLLHKPVSTRALFNTIHATLSLPTPTSDATNAPTTPDFITEQHPPRTA